MSQYNQTQQPSVAYPAAQQMEGSYMAPPPAGYPTREGFEVTQSSQQVETKSRGDGFLKGCFAALCCCCVLDACF